MKGRRVLVSYTPAEAFLMVRAANHLLHGGGQPFTNGERTILKRAIERTEHKMDRAENAGGEMPQPGNDGKQR
jgi:hypothetical protein